MGGLREFINKLFKYIFYTTSVRNLKKKKSHKISCFFFIKSFLK